MPVLVITLDVPVTCQAVDAVAELYRVVVPDNEPQPEIVPDPEAPPEP